MQTRQQTSVLTLSFIRLITGVCCLFAFACHPTPPASSLPSQASSLPVPLASLARGRTVYQSQCIACHNPNPKKPGSIGPEIFGSSKALLEARILHATYPPQYTPKRKTHLMAPLPHLKDEIDSLVLYLNHE